MRFLSLFAGIGGIDLGLERAGFTCVAQVEKDPYCQRVLAKHWPDVPRFGDITELGASQLPAVDLICGGFPCQPVSIAGQGKAQADARWLWPHFARLIRDLRPRYVLVENVPGLLSAASGRAAQEVFGDLAELGFDADWASIPAAALGAPHLRYRVFIVAHATGHGDRSKGRYQAVRAHPGGPTGWPSGPSEGGGAGTLADASGERRQQISRCTPSHEGTNGWGPEGDYEFTGVGSDVADPAGVGSQEGSRTIGGAFTHAPRGGRWISEPAVGRVAHGVPKRMDRLRALGNAVVPQVAEWVGHQVMEHARDR